MQVNYYERGFYDLDSFNLMAVYKNDLDNIGGYDVTSQIDYENEVHLFEKVIYNFHCLF